ncbi:hypothetical protein BH23THE1_BH23THE1_22120 [soil metagenome]
MDSNSKVYRVCYLTYTIKSKIPQATMEIDEDYRVFSEKIG